MLIFRPIGTQNGLVCGSCGTSVLWNDKCERSSCCLKCNSVCGAHCLSPHTVRAFSYVHINQTGPEGRHRVNKPADLSAQKQTDRGCKKQLFSGCNRGDRQRENHTASPVPASSWWEDTYGRSVSTSSHIWAAPSRIWTCPGDLVSRQTHATKYHLCRLTMMVDVG